MKTITTRFKQTTDETANKLLRHTCAVEKLATGDKVFDLLLVWWAASVDKFINIISSEVHLKKITSKLVATYEHAIWVPKPLLYLFGLATSTRWKAHIKNLHKSRKPKIYHMPIRRCNRRIVNILNNNWRDRLSSALSARTGSVHDNESKDHRRF